MLEASRHQTEIIPFPDERVQRAARAGATRSQILFGRFRGWAGRLCNRAGLPGAVQPMEIIDKLTGQHVAVSVGELFVCLSVSGRDYYFDRISGRFDGTGSSPI